MNPSVTISLRCYWPSGTSTMSRIFLISRKANLAGSEQELANWLEFWFVVWWLQASKKIKMILSSKTCLNVSWNPGWLIGNFWIKAHCNDCAEQPLILKSSTNVPRTARMSTSSWKKWLETTIQNEMLRTNLQVKNIAPNSDWMVIYHGIK